MVGAPGVAAPSSISPQERAAASLTGRTPPAQPPVESVISPQERAAAVLTGRTPPPVEPPISGSIVSPPPISPPFLDPVMDMVSPSLPPPPPPPPEPPGAAVSARARELKYGSRAERERAARIRARTKVRPLMG